MVLWTIAIKDITLSSLKIHTDNTERCKIFHSFSDLEKRTIETKVRSKLPSSHSAAETITLYVLRSQFTCNRVFVEVRHTKREVPMSRVCTIEDFVSANIEIEARGVFNIIVQVSLDECNKRGSLIVTVLKIVPQNNLVVYTGTNEEATNLRCTLLQ